MKYCLILNPGSHNGKSRILFKGIESLLNDEGVNYNTVITKSITDACDLSAKANKSGYDVVVAIGGDGTINRAINGFYDEKGKRVSNTKMGVIHTGTSPDFCKSYNIPYNDVRKAVKILLNNKIRKIEIGRITLAKRVMPEFDGKPVSSVHGFETFYFGCCVNVGLGASIASYANSGIRSFIGDIPGTFISILRALVSQKRGDYIVSYDGKISTFNNVSNISVGKTFYIASGIKIKNDLSEGDNRFYNLIIKDLNLARLPYCLKKIYSGNEIPSNEIFSMEYAKVIEIYGNSRNPAVEFDGDPRGFLPCRVEMAEDPLDLIMGD